MTKQQKTALNMAKFIQNQSLLLLEKLNELDLDVEADLCEKLHDDAEHLFRTLSSRLDALQDGNRSRTERGFVHTVQLGANCLPGTECSGVE